MRLSFLAALSVLAAVGSAQAQQVDQFGREVREIVLREGTPFWGKDTQEIQVTKSSSGISQTRTFNIPLVQENLVQVDTLVSPAHEEPTGWVTVSIPIVKSCTGDGKGQSDAWDNFYQAPKSRKANALADAIKGVGEKSAEKLVNRGFFNRKPRSWDAFASEIQRAENAKVITEGVASQVLNKYAIENMESLGYDRRSCVILTQDTRVPTGFRWVEDQYISKNETRSKVLITEPRTLQVVVNNPALQSFEAEKVLVSVGREQHFVSFTAKYTQFASRLNGNTLTLQGQGRDVANVLPPPTSEMVTWAGFKSLASPKMGIQINVNPKYFKPEMGSVQVVVRYEVEVASGIFASWRKLEREEVLNAQDGNIVEIWGVGSADKYIRGKVYISLRGSSLYDGRFAEPFALQELNFR